MIFWLRRGVQAVCLTLFLFLVFSTAQGKLHDRLVMGPQLIPITEVDGVPSPDRFQINVPPDLFLRADPLVWVGTWLAARKFAWQMFLPALLIVLLTLVAGRVFCGWICPLGTTIDLFDRFLHRRHRARPKRDEIAARRPLRNVKYYLLGVVLVGALCGSYLGFWLDPISLLTRTLALSLIPALVYLWNTTCGAWSPELLLEQHTYRMNLWVLGMFIAILWLAAYQERFWCRNLCPLGGLLAVLARVSFLRHFLKESCVGCSLCELRSRMGAYENMARRDEKEGRERRHLVSECIHCFRCIQESCPHGSLQARFAWPWRKPAAEEVRFPDQPGFNLNRRRLFGLAVAAAGWSVVAKTNARGEPNNNRCLRPPGSLPESQFLQACTRCGECMRVCPSGGLQPAFLEAGLEGMWTPILVPKIGACEMKCTLCGEACPTNAIQNVTLQDKKHRAKLGLAVINEFKCVAWNQGRECIVCDEVCSYQAIHFIDVPFKRDPKQIVRVPTVLEEVCTGCGLCEHYCPVRPEHAIVVYAQLDPERRPHFPQDRRLISGFREPVRYPKTAEASAG